MPTSEASKSWRAVKNFLDPHLVCVQYADGVKLL